MVIVIFSIIISQALVGLHAERRYYILQLRNRIIIHSDLFMLTPQRMHSH